jgi:hypothetical protein
MKRIISISILIIFLLLSFTETGLAQRVLIGPRITGNFNIYNEKGMTDSYNGLGVGVGGTIDALFSKHIGIMGNLTFFDMRNFSNSQSIQNFTIERSLTLSYLTIDPLFKAEFSGFYMIGGPSIGIKLNSSGEITQTQTGVTPVTEPMDLPTKSVRFDIAVGAGYTFSLSKGMYLGTDFMAHIPLSDTYDFPGVSNSIFSLKLGVALKFRI